MRSFVSKGILTLSLGLNVVLILALSTLLYLVYPQFIHELDSMSYWDQYSVRTYREYEGGTACFEVLKGYRRLYSYSGKQAFFVESFGADVTGNGVPDLVIQQWDGSAHGNARYLVLELDGSMVKEIEVIDSLLGAKCQDLNEDGVLELTGMDKSYTSLLGQSRADSPIPSVVLSFDQRQARFVLDQKLTSRPPFPQDQIDELSLRYKNDIRWSKESRPPAELFITMFDLIYAGNEKQAWELFDASWPEGSTVPQEEYKEEVKAELSRSPFYPVIAGWGS